MTTYTADMTEREIGEFLAEAEGTGMLGFGGENPYVIPMGCIYRRGGCADRLDNQALRKKDGVS